MKTDRHSLLFLKRARGLHGDLCFQLRRPNEHVCVPEFSSPETSWAIKGPAGVRSLKPARLWGQKINSLQSIGNGIFLKSDAGPGAIV